MMMIYGIYIVCGWDDHDDNDEIKQTTTTATATKTAIVWQLRLKTDKIITIMLIYSIDIMILIYTRLYTWIIYIET